jgi:hypothetical protein
MPTRVYPTLTSKEYECIVHIKRNDCGPTNRCSPNQVDSHLIPYEMVAPRLLAGMIERDGFTREWINGVGLVAFSFVAMTTGATKI